MDLGLKNKVALVAGSSSGLGEAVAKVLACEGASLILCARSADKLSDSFYLGILEIRVFSRRCSGIIVAAQKITLSAHHGSLSAYLTLSHGFKLIYLNL
jgi:NAD(P)-dependent dehydrogenase (short-subunit alcohol dehydrogenase family)